MSESQASEVPENSDGADEEWTDPAVRLQELDADDEVDQEGDSISAYYIFQAFLVPTIVVGLIVLTFLGVRYLFVTGQSTDQLVSRITGGGERNQWVAAAQLGKRLQTNEKTLHTLRRNSKHKEAFRTRFAQTHEKKLKIFLAQILGLIQDAKAVPVLENELQRSSSDAVRVMILRALGDIGHASSAEMIGSFLDSDSPALRQAAVDAAGRLGNPNHIEPLVDRLDDPIPHVKLTAAIALSKYGTRLNSSDTLRVVQKLVDYMDREMLEKQIKNADFQPPSLENNPMWQKASEKEKRDSRRKIDRLQHINQMRISAVVALNRLIRDHSGQMQFLKPKKSRDRILDQIRENIRLILDTSQKTSRPLRRESRTLLTLLNTNQNE